MSVSLHCPFPCDPAGRLEQCLVSAVVSVYTQQPSHSSLNTSAVFPADGTNHKIQELCQHSFTTLEL